MRFHVALLLGLLATSPARAQPNQNAEPPAGQTLLNGLIGKGQAPTSRLGEPLPGRGADQETQEQREHYRNNITKNTTTSKSASDNSEN